MAKRLPMPGGEALSLMLLGGLLLYHRWRNTLVLLIHSNYLWLATVTGLCLISLGIYRWRQQSTGGPAGIPGTGTGLGLGRLGMTLLLVTAVLGWLLPPKPLSGQTALNRGVSQTLSVTHDQPQSFQPQVDPRQRSLIDWVRTLDVNPDPYTYVDQPVNVDGFVLHPPDAEEGSFWIARFLISCCAADAYPVGLPVIWPQGKQLPADSWQQVQGIMQVDETDQLQILASQVEPIPTPVNPYDY